MPITTAVRTDRDKVRPRNEDAVGLFPELQTYVVADGLGGGQVASPPAPAPSRPYGIHCDIVRKAGTNLQQAGDVLVDLANARGGQDDSTVVALRYSPALER